MPKKNNTSPNIKHQLHPRNKHRTPYDFKQLIITLPDLSKFIQLNKYNNESIDFFDPEAVKMLNKALLIYHYDIEFWDIPRGYLCPPIPGRADYIYHISDILAAINQGRIPKGKSVNCLDIGIGANCIYPIIGHQEYGWSFVGTDVDDVSIESCNNIISKNKSLKDKIEIRKQALSKTIFEGIIQKEEFFDLTICNPPFHASAEAAASGSLRKLKNLTQKKINDPVLNFGGKNNELWCEGGEAKFVERMILESPNFGTSVLWFSTLVSKKSNLKKLEASLKKVEVAEWKVIPMSQGNKTSQILVWSFLTKKQQKIWAKTRW